MMPFDTLFSELASRETRALAISKRPGLPAGTYVFREFFCNDPGCDCRRVLLQIHAGANGRVVATINYSFEPPLPPYEDEGQMFLDPLNPQSDLSDGLLRLFEATMPSDVEYREMLIRHYELWKSVVDDPTHPDHAKVRSEAHGDPTFQPAFRRQEPKVGRNDPCPCGSGKKSKKCCCP